MTPLATLVVDDDPVSRAVMEEYVALCDDLALHGSCGTAVEAANVLRKNRVDLLLLDVEMPQMSGLELIASLKDPPRVILVSGRETYALEAFEADVVDYLLKPVTYARFLKAVERLNRKARAPEATTESDHVFIKSDGKLVRLELSDILFLQAERDYVLIQTTATKHLIHGTMKSMEEKLSSADFIRVHRSYIVRIDRIDDIQDGSVVVGRSVVPIGESYREQLHARLRTL